MGSIYKRGDRYYVRFKDQEGKWVARSAADSMAEAKKVLREVEKGVKSLPPARIPLPAEPQHMTIREIFPIWVEARKARGLRGWFHSARQFEIHVLPVLGDMKITEVKARHIRNFVDGLPLSGLAPRSIRWVYALTRKFFVDQVVDEVIPHSPCVLTKDQLPKNRDRDPEWRANALFSREEVELILSAPDVPEDRRLLNALLFLTGARLGEICGLRWRNLDTEAVPLQRLLIARSFYTQTKTESPRQVPVHPLLAMLLNEWRTSGYKRLMGRDPRPDDVIVPARSGLMRNRARSWSHHAGDLEQLGLRHRRIHDTRRTFITLARVDGARRDVLEQITHNAKGNIMDMYTTLPWHTLCEAVSCLKLRLLTPEECFDRQKAQTELLLKSSASHEDPSSMPDIYGAGKIEDGPTTMGAGPQLARDTLYGKRPHRRSGNGVGRTRPLNNRPKSPVTDRVTRQENRRVRTRKWWEIHAISMGAEMPSPLYTSIILQAELPTMSRG